MAVNNKNKRLTHRLTCHKFNLFFYTPNSVWASDSCLAHWWSRLERSRWGMASLCAEVIKPGKCIVSHMNQPQVLCMGVVLYPVHSVADTSSPYFVSFVSLAHSNNVSKQTVLQAITASESHPTRPCLDTSQWVQCEGESARWSPG